jgi:class I fructose-bisphosphate aldolase
MNTGKLAGTGKMVIFPVDQGFEHGPGRSFQPNPAGYDPLTHVEFAMEGGCNAYAAPLGFIETAANEYPGEIPMILKINNNNSLYSTKNPLSALTSGVQDALEMGCHAIGFTIYPGTSERNENFWQLKEAIREAHDAGLAAVVWAYARGENLSKEGETAVDVIAYSTQIAAQMGADIIKVKPPTAAIGLAAAESAYESVAKDTLKERIEHVMESAFNGKRITIFSGGAAKGKEAVLEEISQIKAGGGFGSIMGRNLFQRPKEEALQLLDEVIAIYKS